ncbi:unnamed protein product [Acanthoscelides obtectus]|uniref:Mitogen-activated protein kinase kinase kinase n=1 Tax=Acanthoscelides obtectus TaxID=200917 RepID=A0A9P0P6F5_ACAOB|nr:unnamed protein product [Acanthoscelides obtectus]CAK1640949.1 Mitogen-activated protein kinase kinase kinase 7 [Acanthoscelides obtectus]
MPEERKSNVISNFTFAGTASTIQAGVQSSSEKSSSSNGNQDLGKMFALLDSLDPHLRPVTPDFNDEKSVQLYEEHKKLVEEYCKVQEELVFMTQKHNQLLAEEAEDQQRQLNLKALQEEKESLMLAKNLLQQQRERTSAENAQSRNSANDWVILSRRENNN